MRRRSTLLAPDDEDLLASRHLLGSALARSGDAAAALPHLRQVVRRRSSMEIPESRRLLAARHSYGVCLMMLGLHTEGATELDAVVASRAVAMDSRYRPIFVGEVRFAITGCGVS